MLFLGPFQVMWKFVPRHLIWTHLDLDVFVGAPQERAVQWERFTGRHIDFLYIHFIHARENTSSLHSETRKMEVRH